MIGKLIQNLSLSLLCIFVLGAGAVPAQAQVVLPAVCLACPWGVCPCSPVNTARDIERKLSKSLKDSLKDSATEVETYVNEKTDDMIKELLDSLNETEDRLVDWWQGMWYDKLLPSLQAMTRQLNVATASQSMALQTATDAVNQSENLLLRQKIKLKSHQDLRASALECPAVTLSGGYGRSNNLAAAMRKAWQKESLATGLGTKGTPGATGAIAAERKRYDEYKDTFCDPNGNGGNNDCGSSDPDYYNADTQPSKFIYNRLTTDVTDPKMARAVETITNNLVGVPSAEPISEGALKSATGQQTFLDRRAYLARYAAVRSVPQLVTGWRMPGSQMGEWVKALRTDAGVPLTDIAANPSYREVMHAASVDRFNSGHYAVGLVTDESALEIEKLTLDVFYLMQLRDYYELLERTALALAVQVSVMTDQVPLPDVSVVSPLR